METMTQNTLADLRSMEHAAEDKKDRYLLGLCTLFVATMEDAKDRISQLELVFCSQLFPAFQAKLLESRQALHQAEILHQQALQELESTREDHLSDMQNFRADSGKETMRINISSEIHQLRQELQELLQEKQLRVDEASHCKLQLEEQAILHKRLSSELYELQQELLRLRKEKDLQEQKNLCRNPHQKEELHKSLASNEPLQRDSLQIEFEKLSKEAAELRQSNIKLLQENQDIHQHCSKLSSELGLLKSKVLSSSSETPPTVAETDALDIKSLQLKLEQKSQERSLECFRRQLISAEVEKEKKATHAALVKLHTLKKRYQSLRKQYTVLFRHSHPLERQKQAAHATICENQEKFNLGDAAVERYSNTNVGELKAKCNCAKARTYTDIPSSSKGKDSPKYAPNLAHEGELSHVSVMDADNHARQVSKEAELTNTLMLQKEVIEVAVMESPESSNSSQSPDGAEKRENHEADKEDRVLDTPPKLNHSENNIHLEKFLQPQKSLLPVKSCDQEIDCIIVSHLDKASQVGSCSSSFLKADLNFGANVDEIAERTESSNSGDNIQEGSRSLESPLPSEDVQGNMKEGPGAQRPADNGWCPVQKRAFSSKCHPKASKSLKTTWRNTRSRAEANDFDPHDDFLDTPHENALRNHTDQAMNDNRGMIALHQSGAAAKISEGKGILKPRCKQEQLVDYGRKVVSLSQITTQAPDQEANFTYCANQNEKHAKEQVGHLGSKNNLLRLPKKHGPCAQHLEGDSRIKDSISAMSKRKVVPVSKQGPMYKYVEPVRKKDEREKLQGVECNQCKKFYDAVLLNNGAGATSARCEHHDVTSRHRYRYMPPSTPEGFWNIGFDSEL